MRQSGKTKTFGRGSIRLSGALVLEQLEFVSDFDIRISDFS
jgi:hypothetical protein